MKNLFKLGFLCRLGLFCRLGKVFLIAGCCFLGLLSACARHSASQNTDAALVKSFGANEPLSFHPQDRSKAPQNDTYYFKYDSDQMTADDKAASLVQANYLATHRSAKIRLEGNTDARGSAEYNIALGWRRAQAVAQVLEMQGVAPDQIKLLSYGKERPAVLGNSESSYVKNRRVNLVYEAY